MISLKDYFIKEEEDKFVSIEYKTTDDSDMSLSGSVMDEIGKNNDEEEETDPDDILPGGTDLALVGELRLFSETSQLFLQRKRKIAKTFKSKLKDEEVNANRIKNTKIFDYYIKHLIEDYQKNVDHNVKLNVSSKNELKRQLASDMVMIIKNMEIFPNM